MSLFLVSLLVFMAICFFKMFVYLLILRERVGGFI